MTISRAYIIALLIIASSITTSEIVVQNAIRNNQSDTHLVNIAGRQRMLSQKIAKAALLLVNAKDSATFYAAQSELKDDLALFTQSHNALQYGDPHMGLSNIDNSATIKAYFQQLENPFDLIEKGAYGLINAHNNEVKSPSNVRNLEAILGAHITFLKLMNDITFQFDIEADYHISHTTNTSITLYIATIVILIASALTIFRPADRKLKKFTKELVEKEKQLAESKARKHYIEQLETKNQELQDYNYITSHDLQEPLKTIEGFSDILKQDYGSQLDEKGRKIIHFISESSKKSSSMIRDLLFYNQIGDILEIENIDSAELLQEIMTSHKIFIEESGATITANELPTIRGYRTELKVLFENMITNAIKYRKEDEKQHIDIKYVSSNINHSFTFSDKGIGIEKKFHKEIFNVFKRVSGKANISGTGIGLAMCKKIVDHHGGRIWVTSQIGLGTDFHIELPKEIHKKSLHQNDQKTTLNIIDR